MCVKDERTRDFNIAKSTMIKLEDGSKEMLPYVRVDIDTGRFWFEYWYQVSYWDPEYTFNGERIGCWVHDWEKDGGGFGLWFVLRKAHEALCEAWSEQWDEMKKKNV